MGMSISKASLPTVGKCSSGIGKDITQCLETLILQLLGL